jgi:hypothetical protein
VVALVMMASFAVLALAQSGTPKMGLSLRKG